MDEIVAAQMPMLGASILGFPAMSVPVVQSDGFPMGVQVVSARFRERSCLNVAELIERHSGVKTLAKSTWADTTKSA